MQCSPYENFTLRKYLFSCACNCATTQTQKGRAFYGVKGLCAIHTILNLGRCRGARIRNNRANGLVFVILRICAVAPSFQGILPVCCFWYWFETQTYFRCYFGFRIFWQWLRFCMEHRIGEREKFFVISRLALFVVLFFLIPLSLKLNKHFLLIKIKSFF